MSDKGTVSPKEKEATEKRGRGRPRKQPQVKTSDVSSTNLYFQVCQLLLYIRVCMHENTIGPCVVGKGLLRCKTRLTNHKLTSVPVETEVTQVYDCR